MRALLIDAPGSIRLQDLPEPPLPAGECRVEMTLAGICRTDLELSKGYMGFKGIPGHEFVGVVREGPAPLLGKRVVGEINAGCGHCPSCQRGLQRHCPNRTVLGILGRPGAFANSLSLPPENLLVVPDSISDDEAVFTEPLAAALEIFEQLEVPAGERVLVIGDGKLGLLIAQVFALQGHRVTLQGKHERKLALARTWGVESAARVEQQTHFPLIVEATGSPAGFQEALERVEPRGTIVLKSTYAPGELPALDAAKVVVNEIRIVGSRCGRFAPALELLATGRVKVRGLIDASMPLEQGVQAFERAAQRGALKILMQIGARNTH